MNSAEAKPSKNNSKSIGTVNAYSAFFGAVVGVAFSLISVSFFVGGQWGQWTEIRDAHKINQVINQDMTPPDVSKFLTDDDIPDLSIYATKSDLTQIEKFPQGSLVMNIRGSDCPSGWIGLGLASIVAPEQGDLIRYIRDIKAYRHVESDGVVPSRYDNFDAFVCVKS